MRYMGEEEYCGLYSETHRKVTKAIKCWAGGEGRGEEEEGIENGGKKVL